MSPPRLTQDTLKGLASTGPSDPIHYYSHRLVGPLYRERINMGLGLLPARAFRKGLEVGYGAGAVQLVLAPHVDELHGLDLDADAAKVTALLAGRGYKSQLVRGSLYELPYADQTFDLVVCFSVFEHLTDPLKGLREVARVLTNDGSFLLGMPAVNRVMEFAFKALGVKDINDLHITPPRAVAALFSSAGLRVARERRLGVPGGPSIYRTWVLERSFQAA